MTSEHEWNPYDSCFNEQERPYLYHATIGLVSASATLGTCHLPLYIHSNVMTLCATDMLPICPA